MENLLKVVTNLLIWSNRDSKEGRDFEKLSYWIVSYKTQEYISVYHHLISKYVHPT